MLRLRRILVFFVALAVMAGSGAAALAESHQLDKLRTDGKQAFVGAAGPEQLKGPNVQPIWLNEDGTAGGWGQDTYDSIKAKGFTAVRFVLFWDNYEPQQGQWNEAAFGALAAAVDRAGNAGLYIVFDCIHLSGQPEGQEHIPAWAQESDGMAATTQNGLNFLKQIASRFGTDSAVAAYDPVNEPYTPDYNFGQELSDYTKIVNAIRTVDTDTVIMIEPIYGDSLATVADFSSFTPSNRSNLVWSIHDYYQGGEGDGYNDSTGASTAPNLAWGNEVGYDPADKADLALHLNAQISLASQIGMPLWIGEFGIGNLSAGHDQLIKDKVALYKANGLGYSWWEYYTGSGDFSMTDGDGNWYPWVDLML